MANRLTPNPAQLPNAAPAVPGPSQADPRHAGLGQADPSRASLGHAGLGQADPSHAAEAGVEPVLARPRYGTVRLVSLPSEATLGAAHDRAPAAARELVFVSLHDPDDLDTALGWGECSALNAPTYTDEWARGAFELLTSEIAAIGHEAPMAAAALDMADRDAALRAKGLSLADSFGTTGRSVRAGATVGLGSVSETLAQVEELVKAGYRRVKCKVTPEHLAEPVRAVLTRFPQIEIQIDANGSLRSEHLPELLALADRGLAAIEQPFAVTDEASASRLVGSVAQHDVAIVADEALTTVDNLRRIAERCTASAVSIKPPRVGGIGAAVGLVALADEHGLACAIGGMLESGLGRHALAAIAGLDAFTITGDLSPARRWLAADPFPDLVMEDGHIAVPAAVGIAGDPDLTMLDAHTVARWTGRLPRVG